MKAPAFQFYAADFLADENVELMSNQELGCFIRLLCYCWREGSIPSDIRKIARLCREDSAAMAQLWLAISSCFAPHPTDDSRLVNPRLEQEREAQEQRRKERAESGRKGAKNRWNKGNADNSSEQKDNGKDDGSAINQPMATDSPTTTTAVSTTVPVVVDAHEERESNLPPLPEIMKFSDFHSYMLRQGFHITKVDKPEARKLYTEWVNRGITLTILNQAWEAATEITPASQITSPMYLKTFVDTAERKARPGKTRNTATGAKLNGTPENRDYKEGIPDLEQAGGWIGEAIREIDNGNT